MANIPAKNHCMFVLSLRFNLRVKIMRHVYLLLRILLFVALLGFAIKNNEVVTVRYVFDFEWQAPLAVVLFMFLALGAVLGVLSMLGTIWRLRRELKRVRTGQVNVADGQQPDTPKHSS